MEKAVELIFGLLILAFDLLMLALPFLLLYAVYRVIKGLMTHNANLKNQRDNDRWNPEGRD